MCLLFSVFLCKKDLHGTESVWTGSAALQGQCRTAFASNAQTSASLLKQTSVSRLYCRFQICLSGRALTAACRNGLQMFLVCTLDTRKQLNCSLRRKHLLKRWRLSSWKWNRKTPCRFSCCKYTSWFLGLWLVAVGSSSVLFFFLSWLSCSRKSVDWKEINECSCRCSSCGFWNSCCAN